MPGHLLQPPCSFGTACSGCGQRLPLRFSESNENAALWECVSCRAQFAGMLLPDLLASLARHVRLAPHYFDATQAAPLPGSVPKIVQQVHNIEPPHGVREMRRSTRICGRNNAIGFQFDEREGVLDPPLETVVANLSSHGMLMITGVPFEAPMVIIQLDQRGGPLQLVARIIWSRHLGRGCYGAGTEFLGRFGKLEV